MENKSEQMQEYTLRVGSHTWIDGKTYSVGDKMVLTREQMERIGKERFEGGSSGDQTLTAAESSSELESLREENRQLRERVKYLGAYQEAENEEQAEDESYAEFLNRSVPEISTSLQTITDLSVLASIQSEESKDGRPRQGVLKAIQARREELA